jgi:multidrug efflux pump subunit AcrA (membrane-fusion protein)
MKHFVSMVAVFVSGATYAVAQAPATKPAAVVLPASIEAFEVADQYAKVGGYVSEMKVDIGDHVTRGQLLAVIDVPELAQELDEAKATLAARQKLRMASQASVVQAQKMLDVAKSQLASAHAELELADVTLKRQQELFEGKAITDQQLDDVKARATTARANAAVAQAKIAAAEADVASAEANLGVATAQVEVAKAQVGKSQAMFDYTRIVAPFDGVVTRRLVNRGDLTQVAGNHTMPLFTCQRLETVRVFCDVPETSVPGVHPGDTVEVKLYGPLGQTIPASVTRIATALDPQTRTMRAEIDLPNPLEQLRPGMYAQVTIAPGAPPVAQAEGH